MWTYARNSSRVITDHYRYAVRVFRTSDGAWHLQISRETDWNVQVLSMWTFLRLIDAIDRATLLQLHVDNIQELPVSQYALQSEVREGRWAA